MWIRFIKTSALCLSSLAIVAGCAVVPAIGSAPSDTPPKIILDPADNKSLIWDNPGAFGPVPASEAARGEKVCGTLNKGDVEFKAIGYHPKAQNIDGKQFDNGGFFCVRR